MKYCQNCGAGLVETTEFCGECGSTLLSDVSAPPVDCFYMPTLSQDDVLNTVRGRVRSLPFLIMTVALSIFLVYTLIIAVFNFVKTASMESAVSMAGIRTVVNCVPVAMLVVGMWMLYSSASDKRTEFKTKGLTLIKVACIIGLVLILLSLVLAAITLVPLIVDIESVVSRISDSFDGPIPGEYAGVALIWFMVGAMGAFFMWALIVVELVFVVVLIPLSVIYFVKTIKTMNNISSTITTGTVVGKASVFVAVLSIIVGVILALSGLSMATEQQLGAGISILPLAIALIFFAVFLLSYRSKMNALTSIK